MMKIKSVSGLTLYVKNLGKTASFYEALGFDIRKREADHITAYSNWFWMDFVAIDTAARPAPNQGAGAGGKGAGILIYMSVDDVDAFHKDLVSKGLKPAGRPRDETWGNREFGIRDPDGYSLVFFKRL